MRSHFANDRINQGFVQMALPLRHICIIRQFEFTTSMDVPNVSSMRRKTAFIETIHNRKVVKNGRSERTLLLPRMPSSNSINSYVIKTKEVYYIASDSYKNDVCCTFKCYPMPINSMYCHFFSCYTSNISL